MASDIHSQHKVFAAFPLMCRIPVESKSSWVLAPFEFSHLKWLVAHLGAAAALPVWRNKDVPTFGPETEDSEWSKEQKKWQAETLWEMMGRLWKWI